ncbi:hypothetical protein HY623_03100 [Candidatus Uhrbacteria bacterium]|nr:hypothetical protein [Candidatus Uhrbacteria bacterium]
MNTEATEPPKRSYETVFGEVNAKFNALIDSSRKDSAPLDLNRSGALLPDYESLRTYLEAVREEVNTLDILEKFKDELAGVIESRLLTVQNYINILQAEEDRKKGSA